MAKKDTLERSKWIFLGFIFALIIFTGFLLSRALNNEPVNYPTTPGGVVTNFYTWYVECLNSGGNCDFSSNNYLERKFKNNFEVNSQNVVCSKDPIDSFVINKTTQTNESAVVDMQAISSTSNQASLEVRLNKVRGIWKIIDISCGHSD